MQCTFCGTENRPGYKFCGMCGVLLERRQVDRRTQQGGISQKCTSCGHLSEPGLKFCGMCGARIERRVQERRGVDPESRAAAIANAQLPTPEAPRPVRVERPAAAENAVDLPPAGIRRAEPAIFQSETTRNQAASGNVAAARHEQANSSQISGPSFLGLNAQPDSTGEYLLEDEPSGGGLRKVLLLVIVVAILGLIFVQWRSSFKASPKPAPSKIEPTSTPAGENAPPALPNNGPAGKNTTASANASDGPSPAKDPAKDDTAKTSDTAKASEEPIAAVVHSAAAATSPMPEETSNDTADTSKPAETKASPETHLPDNKPSASLVRAQQYLQGRGVPQSCEQGLIYLKAATDKGDPGAAVQMAALYASGHCVKQDRVMAYRWFNSAHELQPANMWIQKNMDQLWTQMSEQERRLAGY